MMITTVACVLSLRLGTGNSNLCRQCRLTHCRPEPDSDDSNAIRVTGIMMMMLIMITPAGTVLEVPVA
jgi:hypothetical protein